MKSKNIQRFLIAILTVTGTAVLFTPGAFAETAQEFMAAPASSMKDSLMEKESLSFVKEGLHLDKTSAPMTELDVDGMAVAAGYAQRGKKKVKYDPFRAARLLMTCA